MIEEVRSELKHLKAENAQLREENGRLKAENAKLRTRVSELEDKLNQNSRNSHLPPSRDPASIKAAIPRKKGKRKPGGKKGHQGGTLLKIEQADECIDLKATQCGCGYNLSGEKQQIIDTRQVFDIPPIKLSVKEYRLMQCQCPKCHRMNLGKFPQYVTAPAQYGPNLKALTVLLNADGKLPLNKIVSLFKDLFNISINENTLLEATNKCYKLLEPFEKEIRSLLPQEKVMHLDETGLLINLDLYWMHGMCTERLTFLRVHPNRGMEALKEVSDVLNPFKGTLIHDFFKVYFRLSIDKHGMCGAHILRELQQLIDQGSKWAVKVHNLIMEMFLNATTKNIRLKTQLLSRYSRHLREGFKEEPPPQKSNRGRDKRSKGLNLLLRLKEFKKEVTAFAFDKDIPFTNNTVEREMRHPKTKLKVSGCFRSILGAHWYARIMSFISTLRKNNQDVYSSLCQLFSRSYTFKLT